MKRHSCTRSVKTLTGHFLLPTFLAFSLTAMPATMVCAQQDQGEESSQRDESARQRAEQLRDSAREELKDDNFAQAREYLEQARATDPTVSGLDKLASQIAEAEREAQEEARQEQVEQILKGAKQLLKEDKYDQALVEVNKALQVDPASEDAKKLQEKIQKEKTKAMEDRLEDEVEARIDAAEEAIDRNQFDQARRELEAARQVAQGLFQDDLADLEEDIQEEESEYIAEQNEERIESLMDTAEELLDANQFERARETVGQVFEYDRNNRDAMKLLSKIGEEEKEFREEAAEREIEQMLDTAEKQRKAGQFEAAISTYQAVQEKDSGNSDARKGLKKVRKEMAKAAEEEIKEDLKAAESLLKAEQYDKAASAYQAILDKDQGNRDARRGLAEAQEEMQKAQREMAQATEEQAEEKTEAADNQDEQAAQEERQQRQRVNNLVRDARTALNNGEIGRAEELLAQAESVDADAPSVRSLSSAIQREKRQMARAAEQQSAEEQEQEQQAATEQAEEEPATRPVAMDEDATEKKEQAEAKAKQAEKKAEEERRQDAARAKQLEKERRRKAEQAFQDGKELYEKGELSRARQRWIDALEIDQEYDKPKVYLEETKQEYNAFLAKKKEAEAFEQAEAEALDKMNTLIPFRTLEPTSLRDFLQTLRLLSGIDFVIVGEVNARVEAAFEDEPLHQVLDSVLLPMGLRWRREPGSDTVIIEPDLRTEVFALAPDQVPTVNALIEEGVIPRLLWGSNGEPIIDGQEIFTDPRQNILVMTDSQQNITKIRRVLSSLEGQGGVQLVWESYEIDESKAPEIKALLGAILASDDDQPFNTDRKLILEGSTLIVKDTPENIQRVRQILQDQNFLKRFYSDELTVATFNLTPVLEFQENPDLVRSFADQVRQVVETLLYSRTGRTAAERQGRRLWYDPATLQLTITDTPDRIQIVQDYIESLPQIRSRRRSKIIFLDHANSGDLVSQIESFLGIEGAADTGGGTEEETTKNLSVEDEFQFRDAFFRVTRVNENDANDDNDDSVELVVRTGQSTQDLTIEEFRSEFIDDFEIVADDIDPSNTPGEGRARLLFRYVPQDTQEADIDEEEEDDEEEERQRVEEETGLSIDDIENLNAIFIEYQNVEDLREVEFWVRTLDIPTLQVSIEVKFVEVVTNKAQKLAPEFVLGDLAEGISFDDAVLRSRFAQDRDEFQSVFDPFIESGDSANLLKGTTVFNYIVSNGNSPISFTLKMLEAQGVINVVNGPTVTVLNTETADFQVTREFGLRQPEEGATGGGDEDNFTLVASLDPVDLSVTPNVTRAGNITLDIDVEMNDFDQFLGQIASLDEGSLSALAPAATTPRAFATSSEFGVLRKELTTQARIKDGGTVVLGGWRNERSSDLESGVPILRDIPFIGKYLFERKQQDSDKITLLIFLTGQVVRD